MFKGAAFLLSIRSLNEKKRKNYFFQIKNNSFEKKKKKRKKIRTFVFLS